MYESIHGVTLCSGYHHSETSFSKPWTQVLWRLKPFSLHVRDLLWWEPLTMARLEIRLTSFIGQPFRKKKFLIIIIKCTDVRFPHSILHIHLSHYFFLGLWVKVPKENDHCFTFPISCKEVCGANMPATFYINKRNAVKVNISHLYISIGKTSCLWNYTDQYHGRNYDRTLTV